MWVPHLSDYIIESRCELLCFSCRSCIYRRGKRGDRPANLTYNSSAITLLTAPRSAKEWSQTVHSRNIKWEAPWEDRTYGTNLVYYLQIPKKTRRELLLLASCAYIHCTATEHKSYETPQHDYQTPSTGCKRRAAGMKMGGCIRGVH